MTILTQRQKKIIYILANYETNEKKEPITMKQIAKMLDLSTRTIIRDFKKIEDWFIENDFKFSIKPGKGLILNEDKATKEYIIDLLNININSSYSELEKKILIFTHLLTSDLPIKSSYFTKILKITETSFNNIFNSLLEYIKNFNLEVVRKKGFGCYLVGEEKNLRTCYISLIYEYYKEQDFVDILKNEVLKEKTKNNFKNNFTKVILEFVNKDSLIKIMQVIDLNINFFNLFLSDESYVELVFLCLISVKRIMQNKEVIYKSLKNNNDTTQNIDQFKIIEKICKDLEQTFDINISLDEKMFISNHFKALKKLSNFKNIENIKISKITKELIELVGKRLNINLLEDTLFFNDLLNHLETSIHRIKMGMKIRNPFLEDIKKEYKDIYNIVKDSIKLIKSYFNLNVIPESEIAYIAMHFIVAYEKALYKNIKINTVLCCPTGVVTSKVLAENILQKFQNINILDIIPVIKINDSTLKSKNVDLIISTVNIKTALRFIKLNPVFDYNSEKIFKKIVLEISKEKLNNNVNNEKSSNINSSLPTNISIKDNKNIFNTLVLSENIAYILKNFKFIKDVKIFSGENLLNFVTSLFLKDEKKQKLLYTEFVERLNLNFPYFEEIDLLLLHCKSKNITKTNIGVINLKTAINFENKNIKHILVMILPEDGNELEMELLSEISISLVNDTYFLNTIKFGKEELILNFLKNIMIKFLIKKLNKIVK